MDLFRMMPMWYAKKKEMHDRKERRSRFYNGLLNGNKCIDCG